MGALVLKNEPVAGARAVKIKVFNPSLGIGADHDTDLSGYVYVRPGTYKASLALGTLTNIRRALTTSSDTIESVDTGLNEVVMTGHAFQNLDGPFDCDESLGGFIAAGDDFWIIVVDENTIAFALSLADAIAGTRISLSGSETGAAITSNALTERGVRGDFLYTFTQGETNHDVAEIEVAILGHATLEGGATVTIDRGSSVWDAVGADGVTRGEEMTRVYRGEVAPYTYDPITGHHMVRNVADTADSHEGVITASGRIDTDQHPV